MAGVALDVFTSVAEQYADFAAYARGESDCLADWAAGVADDAEVQAWLAELPEPKRQPNLVFAAARWEGVTAPGPYAGLRDALLGDLADAIRTTIMNRATQTNEVGRLATLVPAFAAIPGPLALVEAGASAGLCLYPDRFDYRWRVEPAHRDTLLVGSGGPTLRCDVRGPLVPPTRHPDIVLRAGIDLNPLDVADDDAMEWLATLVWPEQDERRSRLRDAVEIARADPPQLTRGDLLEALPDLVAEAGRHGQPVVFHSAVAAYLDAEQRHAFSELMGGLVADGACRWVSNEGKNVLPEVTATGPDVPEELATFVLGLDGQALAWTHGHGASMTWL